MIYVKIVMYCYYNFKTNYNIITVMTNHVFNLLYKAVFATSIHSLDHKENTIQFLMVCLYKQLDYHFHQKASKQL